MSEPITPQKALEIKAFAINWINKVHYRSRKATRTKCEEFFRFMIPDNVESCDPYGVLDWVHWDYGEHGNYPCDFWSGLKYDQQYSPRVIDLCETVCRIAFDLLVKQSGGVVGYTVGDLKRAFDGMIPQWVSDLFEADLNKADEKEGVWL